MSKEVPIVLKSVPSINPDAVCMVVVPGIKGNVYLGEDDVNTVAKALANGNISSTRASSMGDDNKHEKIVSYGDVILITGPGYRLRAKDWDGVSHTVVAGKEDCRHFAKELASHVES
jgi:hypothetical protein